MTIRFKNGFVITGKDAFIEKYHGLIAPLEQPNGERIVFTTPEEYISGTLQVFINGVLEENITEVNASKFKIDPPPVMADESIRVSYIFKQKV
jgi:hypothetical protein